MSKDALVSYYRNTQCSECGGLGDHKVWCILVNGRIQEAFAVLFNETTRPEEDIIRAHALGVKLRSSE